MEKAFILSKHAVNLSDQLELDTQYTGLGIDRVAACLGAEDGIIIDAGSAITIDIMSNGIHLGGYLLPGFSAMRKAFASVSPLLDIEINPKVDLHIFPQNTKDSMSQGVIKPLVLFLESIQSDKRLYFTGGDGKFLSTFFDNAIYDKSLVFKGMLRCIHDKNL
jgi:type III pantothenate kinase